MATLALLCILSTWTPKCQQGGLTLELSVHFPSDSQHFMGDKRLDDDFPFRSAQELLDFNLSPSPFWQHNWSILRRLSERIAIDEPQHEGIGIRRCRRPGAVKRLFGAPLNFRTQPGNKLNLPQAPIVEGLLIRRQFYRQISPESLARMFRESLTSAQWLRMERWHSYSYQQELCHLKGTSILRTDT